MQTRFLKKQKVDKAEYEVQDIDDNKGGLQGWPPDGMIKKDGDKGGPKKLV